MFAFRQRLTYKEWAARFWRGFVYVFRLRFKTNQLNESFVCGQFSIILRKIVCTHISVTSQSRAHALSVIIYRFVMFIHTFPVSHCPVMFPDRVRDW